MDKFNNKINFKDGGDMRQKTDDIGIKYDSDKLRYDLIPADALDEVVRVYTYGAKKYGDRNWEKGLSYGRLFGAMMRHAWTWWRGDKIDKESKIHHLASVVFCALGLLHFELEKDNKNLDDRPRFNNSSSNKVHAIQCNKCSYTTFYLENEKIVCCSRCRKILIPKGEYGE